MKKIGAACAIVLFSLSLLGQKPTLPPPPDDPYTLSVNVDLVLFNLTVTDKKDRVVSGLSEKDFRIFEDGKPQELRLFRAEDTPATVGLVIDNSGSMVNKRSEVIEAAFEFVGESNPQDELFVVNFNDQVTMGLPDSTPFATNSPMLRNALMQIHTDGKTALYDGVAEGLQHLQKGTCQRKALVVLSDGGDNASNHGLKDVLKMAEKSSATIYTIGVFDPYQRDQNPGVLRELAKVSGGEAYVLHTVDGLEQIWRRIAGGIRSQYTVGYVSSNPNRDGTFRNVTISAVDKTGKDLQVRTRKGYLAAK